MYRAVKYKIYPTSQQKQFFAKSFGCCRKIWNLMLSDMIESYKKTGRFECDTPAKYKKKYVYRCGCGLVIDRDHNSAINIKIEGLRILLKAS